MGAASILCAAGLVVALALLIGGFTFTSQETRVLCEVLDDPEQGQLLRGSETQYKLDPGIDIREFILPGRYELVLKEHDFSLLDKFPRVVSYTRVQADPKKLRSKCKLL